MAEPRYARTLPVVTSHCDHTARLGYHQAFTLFQDAASDHAEQLGVGAWVMAERGLFWLTVKTKLEFFDRPRLADEITVRTWPLAPDRLRSVREYALERGGKTLIRGKTEWAVIAPATGKLVRVADVFPADFVPVQQPSFDEPFARVSEDFSGAALLGSYTVRSTDIDLGRHMNNIAYTRAFLGLYSTRALDAMPIRTLELAFRSPCFEGDTLRYYTRSTETGLEFGAFTDAPRPVLLGRLTTA